MHRAELTVVERSEMTARYVELVEQRVSAQVAPKPKGGRPEGGDRKAARDLGIKRDDVRRAKQIAALAPEAKEVARKEGLDDNQSALLILCGNPHKTRHRGCVAPTV